MKKINLSVTLALVVLLAFGTVFHVNAYNLDTHKFQHGFADFKWGPNILNSPSTVDIIIKDGFEDAVSHITRSTQLYVGHNSTSHSTLDSMYLVKSNYYGNCVTKRSGGIVASFTARINSFPMDITHFNVAQSVGVHEILHAAGLDHVSGASIMDSGRTRTRVYTMQVDDYNGINAKYN